MTTFRNITRVCRCQFDLCPPKLGSAPKRCQGKAMLYLNNEHKTYTLPIDYASCCFRELYEERAIL
jgi:hypothetical protein